MDSLTKSGYFRFLAFMLIISSFLHVVFENLPPILRSHHIWTFLWFVSLIVFKSKILKNHLLQFVLVYGAAMLLLLIGTIWIDLGKWNTTQISREFYEITVAISVITYFRMEGDYVGLANLVKWTMLFLLITAIMSIVSSILKPMYAREIIGVSSDIYEGSRDEILSYKKYGGGGYSFVSALNCLFPMLIYYYKNNSTSYFSKKEIMLFIIIFLLALFAIQLFANIIIAIVIIAFSLAGVKNAMRGFITIIVLAAFFSVIPVQIYIDLFQSIAGWFNPDSELNYKFNDMAQYFITSGSYELTGIGSRAARYPMLWESFQTNPLLGYYHSNLRLVDISLGAHLFWMYKLVAYGLLGTIPFLVIIFKQIKTSLKYYDKEFIFYFLLSLVSIIVLGSMKVLGGREFWYTFFIIVPGYYYLPLLKRKQIVKSAKIINANKSQTIKS